MIQNFKPKFVTDYIMMVILCTLSIISLSVEGGEIYKIYSYILFNFLILLWVVGGFYFYLERLVNKESLFYNMSMFKQDFNRYFSKELIHIRSVFWPITMFVFSLAGGSHFNLYIGIIGIIIVNLYFLSFKNAIKEYFKYNGDNRNMINI